jgi:hypothetical protein
MDWPTLVSEMGPLGCTLAVVVWAFLQKRNDPEKDEIFVRLRALEELVARIDERVDAIKSAIEKLEAK